MKILITGSTGFIGYRLVRKLASQGHELYLLVRPQSKAKAKKLFRDLPEIVYIEGSIEKTDVLADIYSLSNHINNIECLVHLAALYDLQAGLNESYMMNVIGTQNIINLMKKMSSIKYFHFYSTYAVNPVLKGYVTEDFLSQEEVQFPDHYSKTKNCAEHIVRSRIPAHIKTVIHRPGIIIGDSKGEKANKLDGPYYLYGFMNKLNLIKPISSKLPFVPLPVHRYSLMPVLPVDLLVDWSAHIISHPKEDKLKCYHLVPEKIFTKDFLEESMALLGMPLKILPVPQEKIFLPFFPLLRLPKEIIFYMKQETYFERSNLEKDYPELKSPSYKNYLPNIISGYLKAIS